MCLQLSVVIDFVFALVFSLLWKREVETVAYAKEFYPKFYGIPRLYSNLWKAAGIILREIACGTWHGYKPHYLCKGKDVKKQNEPGTVIMTHKQDEEKILRLPESE